MEIEVTVWVCPRCGNYYGASSIDGVDLRQEITFSEHHIPSGYMRSHCPRPSCKPDKIERAPHTFKVEV